MATATIEALIDTGPLVAALNRNDRHHRWAVRQLKHCYAPVWTVSPVVSEAMHLLRRNGLPIEPLLVQLERGALAIDRQLDTDIQALVMMCRKYDNVPMSWADAELLALSEQRPNSMLLTLDSDFTVYRRFRSERVPFLSP